MANGNYQCGITFLNDNLDLSGLAIKVAAVTGNYIPDFDVHCKFSDIDPTTVLGTELLVNKIQVNGNLCADNTRITGAAQPNFKGLVFFNDTCAPGSSDLIAYIDSCFKGLPLNPDGSDLSINWDIKGIFGTAAGETAITEGEAQHTLPIGNSGNNLVAPGCIAGIVDTEDMDIIPINAELPNEFFGCHTIYADYPSFDVVPPIVDNQGIPSCQHAKAQLANVMQARILCGQKKTVRWGDRLVSNYNMAELKDLEAEYRDMVRMACDCRRSYRFSIGCH